MQEKLTVLLAVAISLLGTGLASAQSPELSTFQETAQIIIDKSISQNVTASITLQSTSIQEIQVPAELEQKIRENEMVTAVIVTNQEQCVLGVVDQSCIMVNVKRDFEDVGIGQVQETSKAIGDQLIGQINEMLGTDAKLHSVFVHNDDQSNRALDTSGIVSGRGAISVVYTMPMEDTDSMYEKIAALMLSKRIRESGGFYDVARDLSQQKDAKMTLSVIPMDTSSLMQLRLSVDYPGTANLTQIDPFEFLNVKEMTKSDYFSQGFYPLNSLIQVVVLSPEETAVYDIAGDLVPTRIVDGEKIPTDVSRQGWVFDPEQGNRIQGMYIMGRDSTVSGEDLRFSLGSPGAAPPVQPESDDSVIIVAIITAAAAAAAVFYLRGYKRQLQK